MRHDQPDLVGVRGDYDQRTGLGADREPEIPEGVALRIAEAVEATTHDLLDRRLEPGGPGCETEVTQQIHPRSHHEPPFRACPPSRRQQ